MRDFLRNFSLLCVLVLTTVACTANHTDAELRAGELERNATDRAEEERDREIGEEGGVGLDEVRGQEAEAVRESDL